jgi:hypothetical protein
MLEMHELNADLFFILLFYKVRGEARGHISASFDPQRSNKGPLESSCRGAHDRAITPNPSKTNSYGPIWASVLDIRPIDPPI